ncbi:poly-beta-1,6-N-acetyl-D-glucosamine biosynthesis protein PgaD [Parapusillimonas granuli]|uniref:Poly-beta-1,6-N-acetyl-D-glucosamine biosynthesis protein PgaD n=1 Tax=Parapusillimonas granuli TaxID=380911 RepID=A0A853G9Z1_9BURK|nr:poly-beta-1,6-N-acetyl-D-glucosamine biosynthesis protein PgaD [Parapusillimonas granuli]MBB5214317.1 biofilm PGA synthesis protein PgaD [Parapusillimonas granuli]MEB2399130.1 poly-beta-1,6-N-acetyl-D-glucosamine biosynthesis protein PgaD [Alcaligenaceae bacterium]NYT51421.1 poly-beta-1,6-N-acetyl-D-glucosamine biosynthesis protein PgaD [Parapusillimonas granuli]
MNLIITTKRTSLGWTVDAALTALGWMAFFYLFTRGVVSIVHAGGIQPMPSLLDPAVTPLVPTLQTLALYLLVACFNALVVVAWGRYHKRLFRRLKLIRSADAVDEEELASHFHLSCNQLHEIQGSRVTVIYHSNDGAIAQLETDQLRMQPAGNSPVFHTVKVA